MVSNDGRLSISDAMALRGEGFARLREAVDRVRQIGDSIEAVDAALLTIQTDSSSDEQQGLVTACRSLSSILNGTGQTSDEIYLAAQGEHDAARAIDPQPITDHEVALKAEHFQTWLNQASPEELDGIERSRQAVAASGGAW